MIQARGARRVHAARRPRPDRLTVGRQSECPARFRVIDRLGARNAQTCRNVGSRCNDVEQAARLQRSNAGFAKLFDQCGGWIQAFRWCAARPLAGEDVGVGRIEGAGVAGGGFDLLGEKATNSSPPDAADPVAIKTPSCPLKQVRRIFATDDGLSPSEIRFIDVLLRSTNSNPARDGIHAIPNVARKCVLLSVNLSSYAAVFSPQRYWVLDAKV